MKSNTN